VQRDVTFTLFCLNPYDWKEKVSDVKQVVASFACIVPYFVLCNTRNILYCQVCAFCEACTCICVVLCYMQY
jgi:hypothetical protein